MKNKKLSIILSLLVILVPKAMSQDENAGDTPDAEMLQETAPEASPETANAGSPENTVADPAAPADTNNAPSAPPAASATDTPGSPPAASPETSPDTLGAAAPSPAAPAAGNDNNPGTPSFSIAVVAYLNRRIRKVLAENPAKDPANLSLASHFNEERSKLENALIGDPVAENADVKAEQALEDFKVFLQRYSNIESKVKNALDDLTEFEGDANLPVEVKYETLMLLVKLKNSSSLKDAEKALDLYKDFKQMFATNAVDLQPTYPPLTDEYKKYFEEILMILKTHVKYDVHKMESLLEQILRNPEELKQLWTALNELSEEDYDEYDEEEELIASLLSF